jgi:hypothetical protein
MHSTRIHGVDRTDGRRRRDEMVEFVKMEVSQSNEYYDPVTAGNAEFTNELRKPACQFCTTRIRNQRLP